MSYLCTVNSTNRSNTLDTARSLLEELLAVVIKYRQHLEDTISPADGVREIDALEPKEHEDLDYLIFRAVHATTTEASATTE
jgi:hypothetical protein